MRTTSRLVRLFVLASLAPAALACGAPAREVPPSVAPAAPPPAAPELSASPAPAAHTTGATATAEHHAGPPHWTYAEAEGWGTLAPEFAACKAGTKQTPIDLSTNMPKGKLSPIAFSYKPLPLVVRNNGHTIQADNTTPSSIVVGPAPTDKYDLVQLHFHSPSEHTVDGKAFDMEMHLVHKNSAGQLAVVGMLFKKGKENAILAPIWENAPAEVTAEAKTVTGVSIDLTKLIPAKPGYFQYTGSLTTPPCSEGVSWFVLAPVLEASEAQITRFREVTHGTTNRPVQPANGRQVLQFKP